MAKRPPQRKNAEIDIFDDVDLDVAQSMLSDATGGSSAEPNVRVKRAPPATTVREEQKKPLRDVPPAPAVNKADVPIVEEPLPESVAVEPTNVLLKFRVRQAARAEFDSFKAELSVALGGARLTDANIGRALMDWVLFEVADEILEAARQQPGLRRPASDDAVAMAEFDKALQDVVKLGVYRKATGQA